MSVITIGDCTIYHGDSLEILPSISSVDAFATDPPYGIADNPGGPRSRSKQKSAYVSDFDDTSDYVVKVCAKVVEMSLKIAKRGAVSCGRVNQWFYPQPDDVGCFYQPAASGVSFWGRPTWQPILFYGTAPHAGQQLMPLHRIVVEQAENNGHPCPKPINAWKWVVERTSKLGETVLDPFMGSGTTGVACVRMGRKFIGIELEAKYFDISCRRIEEAYKQRDLFLESPAVRSVQLDLLMGEL